jgi:periplasmic divalent cation tolerance protein
MTQSYLQVSTTTDSRQEAAAIAKAAVEERLAASAQLVGPVASTYWWEGEVESAEEWMVLFKTTHDRFEELARLIVEQHSYDTPEIIATPVVAGSADYLDWISDQTEDLPGDDVYESDDDLDDDIVVDDLAEDDDSAGKDRKVAE